MLGDFVKKLLFTRQFIFADGKIEILDERRGLIPLEYFVDLQEKPDVYDKFKSVAKRDIAYSFKKFGMNSPKFLQEIFELFGFGKLTIVNLGKDKAIVRITECPFIAYCLEHHVKTESCKISSGLLAGSFSHYLSKDVDCTESSCTLDGNKYCEFIIKFKKKKKRYSY